MGALKDSLRVIGAFITICLIVASLVAIIIGTAHLIESFL